LRKISELVRRPLLLHKRPQKPGNGENAIGQNVYGY